MSRRVRWVSSTGLLAAGLSVVVLAQAPALDLRIGLWELTSTIQLGGEMPSMNLGKMTPEQQAQMDAAMKAMMTPQTAVDKSCITKEKLNQADFLMKDEPGTTCKQVYTTNTRTTLDASVTCTGDRQITEKVHVDASSPTAMKATIKTSTTEDGKTSTLDVTMMGKWLGADCGKTD